MEQRKSASNSQFRSNVTFFIVIFVFVAILYLNSRRKRTVDKFDNVVFVEFNSPYYIATDELIDVLREIQTQRNNKFTVTFVVSKHIDQQDMPAISIRDFFDTNKSYAVVDYISTPSTQQQKDKYVYEEIKITFGKINID